MKLNIIDAVYCPKYDIIVSLAVCKKGQNNEGCPHYTKEKTRNDGLREIICSNGEKEEEMQHPVHCVRCGWKGKRLQGPLKECPHCKGMVVWTFTKGEAD